MRARSLLCARLALLLAAFGFAAACNADILLAGISEATGAGAVAGTSFRNGYTMAVDETNAEGGVLGQKLVLRQFDIDTRSEAAEAAAKEAAALKPFAVLGPVFSGLTLAAMPSTAGAGIPHFTGGEAASLTRKFHPSLLRTSLTQSEAVPRLASFAVYALGARRVGLLWIDNEFGRNGRSALGDVVRRRGGEVTLEEAVAPGTKDLSAAVQRVAKAGVDALVLLLNEDEAVGALKELARQGFNRPVIGDGPTLSTKVIEQAGPAAEGLIGHTGFSSEVPAPNIARFVADYQRRYGAKPDHNAAKGYFAVQVLRVSLRAVGRADREAFLKHIRDTRLDGHADPKLLTSSVTYDMFGDLNHGSYVMQVRGGRPRLIASLSAIDRQFVELPGGRSLALNSDELRREVQTLLRAKEGTQEAANRATQR